ncbi:MAG TPA: hypothetical protein VFU81_01725 [Thermomicrobiales bacterium]|nr:hypothetical protein [Thermomicrobiales bacterium]
MNPAPAPDDPTDCPAPPGAAPGRSLSPRRFLGWSDATWAKAQVLLIAAIALGGIVCMMAITAIVLVVHLRR